MHKGRTDGSGFYFLPSFHFIPAFLDRIRFFAPLTLKTSSILRFLPPYITKTIS